MPTSVQCGYKMKTPTKSELEQLFSLGDHKLDRQSPLLPVLPGLPVHIAQNIAPKLGLANVSTGTFVGYQFPKDTIFKPMSFQECLIRLFSKPLEIIYVSVDQARFKNGFPSVTEGFPENTVPTLPFSPTKQIICLPNRKFRVKNMQIPSAPAIAGTTYKLQGKPAKQ